MTAQSTRQPSRRTPKPRRPGAERPAVQGSGAGRRPSHSARASGDVRRRGGDGRAAASGPSRRQHHARVSRCRRPLPPGRRRRRSARRLRRQSRVEARAAPRGGDRCLRPPHPIVRARPLATRGSAGEITPGVISRPGDRSGVITPSSRRAQRTAAMRVGSGIIGTRCLWAAGMNGLITEGRSTRVKGCGLPAFAAAAVRFPGGSGISGFGGLHPGGPAGPGDAASRSRVRG